MAAHRLLVKSVVKDLGLTQMVFDCLGLSMTEQQGIDLIERMDVVHEHLMARARREADDKGKGKDRGQDD